MRIHAHRLRQVAHRLLRVAPVLLTGSALVWLLTFAPFARPMAERSADQLRAHLSVLVARTVDEDWLLPRLEAALAAEDTDETALLLDLAEDHGVSIPDTLLAEAERQEAEARRLVNRIGGCAACAWDIEACKTLAQIGTCALPVELTPAGDLNALRRGAGDAMAGREIDRLDVGLALVGLTATGAIAFTGGGSATVKLGAGLLRAARRLGSLTAPLARELRVLADLPIRWGMVDDLILGRAQLDAVTDVARLNRLSRFAGDVGTIRRETSTAEALDLLRYAGSADEVARIARISTAMGPDTRRTFRVLGKQRVLRATVRLADVTIAALAALYALVLQLGGALAQALGGQLLKALRRLI